MPNKGKYDKDTRAKAIRRVREHAGDYATEWAAITAVSGRLGMSAETLRKWIRQAEVHDGAAPGVSTSESAEIRELKRKNRELEQTIEILKAATSFSRGSATRYATDLRIHRRAEGLLRGRTDLPRVAGAWHPDRPKNLLGTAGCRTVQTSPVGHGDDRDRPVPARFDSCLPRWTLQQ